MSFYHQQANQAGDTTIKCVWPKTQKRRCQVGIEVASNCKLALFPVEVCYQPTYYTFITVYYFL